MQIKAALDGDAKAAFLVEMMAQSGEIDDATRDRVREVHKDGPQPDPKMMANLEAEQHIKALAVLPLTDHAALMAYLEQNPDLPARMLMLAGEGARRPYDLLRMLWDVLTPEQQGELEAVPVPAEPIEPSRSGPQEVDWTELVLEKCSERLLVVDTDSVYGSRESGVWVDLTRATPPAIAVVQAMVKSLGADGTWGRRKVDDVRTGLFRVMEQPRQYGVVRVRSERLRPCAHLRTEGTAARLMRGHWRFWTADRLRTPSYGMVALALITGQSC